MAEAFAVTLDELLLPAYGVHDGARVVEVTPDLARMFGYDAPEELRGCEVLDLIEAAYRDKTARLVVGGESGSYESVGKKKGGMPFPVEVSAHAIVFHGSPARMILVRDLSPVALVVDDEALVGRMTGALLGRLGYRTLFADSARGGLARFRPKVLSLAATDVVMPEMDGIEFGARLRAADATLPIVYVSGYIHEGLVLDDNSVFIQKPFGLTELEEAIGRLPERARTRLGRKP